MSDSGASDPGVSAAPVLELFWRPGCGFCARLISNLGQLAIPYASYNIWDDPDAAAFVRSVDRGNETVPTVRLGDVAMVNPSMDQLIEAIGTHAPSLLDQ